MEEYKVNKLKKYIDESNVVTINDNFKIRMSNELLTLYENGIYDYKINLFISEIKELMSLNIKYPANAFPVFYLYIVPNDNFKELLSLPSFRNTTGGGRPVMCYDIDGFNRAYGLSSNMLENKKGQSMMSRINSLHELSHLVESMFFIKDRYINEGIAEAVPLYILNYEEKFIEYKELLLSLKDEDILNYKDLIELSNNGKFDTTPLLPNKSVSFELPYISSYLFIKKLIKAIETNFNLNKVEAFQKLLEIIRSSNCTNEWLVYDITDSIGISIKDL